MASKKNKRPTQVTKPVLEFKTKDNKIIRLWIYDAGQTVHFKGFRTNGLTFGGEKTGGLVYEELGPAGHNATDYNLENESTWQWIQKWMEKGLFTESLLSPDHVMVKPENFEGAE